MAIEITRRAVGVAMLGAGAAQAIPFRSSAAASPAGAGSPAQALADRYVAARKVSGVVIGIGERSGETRFVSAGSGAFGGAPATADTIWRIYSMTKPITAFALMMLVEAGKLHLDQPLADIFPAYRTMRVLDDPKTSLASRPATRPILLRHVVTHSAGFGYGPGPGPISGNGPIEQRYVERGLIASARKAGGAGAARSPNTLIEFADALAEMPLRFEPGSAWHYSLAIDLAGAIVEKVGGMPFAQFLERRIFTPLGMADTAFFVPATKMARFATNYDVGGPAPKPIDQPGAGSSYAAMPAIPSGGGGLVSTARDYARFTALLLGEGQLGDARLMKRETARTMMSNLLDPGVTALFGQGFGAGGAVVIKESGVSPFGKSLGSYGWAGAAGTAMFADRAAGRHAVLMTQYMPADRYPLMGEFALAAYG